jgi:hypothetical protein
MATAQVNLQDELPDVAAIEAGIAADAAKVRDRAAKDAEFKAVIQKDLATIGLDPNNPETLINIALATSPLGAGEKAAADIARGVMPRATEFLKPILEKAPEILAKIPETIKRAIPDSVADAAWALTPFQHASASRMAKFDALERVDARIVGTAAANKAAVDGVKLQMSTVGMSISGILTGAVGTTVYVLNKDEAEKAAANAKLPLNDQKALAYEAGHINQEKRKESLEKYPDLKEAFAAYDAANAEAQKRFPESELHNSSFEGQYGGQSEASSKQTSYTYQASQAIYNAIKKGEPIPHESQLEKHSSLQGEKLTPADLSTVLQQMASCNPDAALAYAQYLNNDQAQQTMQVKAPEAQV